MWESSCLPNREATALMSTYWWAVSRPFHDKKKTRPTMKFCKFNFTDRQLLLVWALISLPFTGALFCNHHISPRHWQRCSKSALDSSHSIAPAHCQHLPWPWGLLQEQPTVDSLAGDSFPSAYPGSHSDRVDWSAAGEEQTGFNGPKLCHCGDPGCDFVQIQWHCQGCQKGHQQREWGSSLLRSSRIIQII